MVGTICLMVRVSRRSERVGRGSVAVERLSTESVVVEEDTEVMLESRASSRIAVPSSSMELVA